METLMNEITAGPSACKMAFFSVRTSLHAPEQQAFLVLFNTTEIVSLDWYLSSPSDRPSLEHSLYSITTFADLGLAEPLLRAIADAGYADAAHDAADR